MFGISPKKQLFIFSNVSVVLLFFFLMDNAITTDFEYLNKVCGTNHRIDAVDVVFYIHDNKNIQKANTKNTPVDVYLHRKQLVGLTFKIKLITYAILCFEFVTSVILGLKIYLPAFLSEYPLLVSASNHNNRIRKMSFVADLFLLTFILILHDHLETLFHLSNCTHTLFSWITVSTLIIYFCVLGVRIYCANRHVKDDEILKPEYQSNFLNKKVREKEDVVIDLPNNVSMDDFKERLKN